MAREDADVDMREVAASMNVPLLLCAYEDPADLTSHVWNVPFEGEDLRRLAGAAS